MASAPTHPLSLKERQRAEREALILDEAERILAEQGYQELVMEHLAERVGVGKGTLYLHFPSKEDLVVALLARGLEHMSERVAAAAARDGTACTRLRGIMEILIDKGANLQALEAPIRRELLETVERQGHTNGRFQDLFAQLFERIGAVIDQGKARGEFAPDVVTPVAVLLLLNSARAAASSHLSRLVALDPTQTKESIMRLYIDGVRARDADEERGS